MAPSILVRSKSSNTPNSVFCMSIVSASNRLRKVVIGGRSSRSEPSLSVNRKSGGVFEGLKRAALDLAAIDQKVDLAQRRPGVEGFEIVVGAEQPLAAGLALALGDGAERIKAAGDGGEKALLRLDVGGDWPEQRRLRLVGAVRAAKALNGGVGLPARFEQVVDPQALFLRRKVGVIGTSGAAGIGKHENVLLVIHEGLRLGEIGRSGTGLNGEAVGAILPSLAHDAPRASRDLGHHVGAEPLHNLVERALDGRKRSEPLD